jgi:hypothetical protein
VKKTRNSQHPSEFGMGHDNSQVYDIRTSLNETHDADETGNMIDAFMAGDFGQTVHSRGEEGGDSFSLAFDNFTGGSAGADREISKSTKKFFLKN